MYIYIYIYIYIERERERVQHIRSIRDLQFNSSNPRPGSCTPLNLIWLVVETFKI